MGAEGGVLRLTIKKSDNRHLAIIFTDTGSGFPEKDVDKLFKPFYTTKEEGTGLGLVVIKKLVEENNGTIEVRSIVEKGTTFIISFPTIKNDQE